MNKCRHNFQSIHISHNLFDTFKFVSYKPQTRNFFTFIINRTEGHMSLFHKQINHICVTVKCRNSLGFAKGCYKDHILGYNFLPEKTTRFYYVRIINHRGRKRHVKGQQQQRKRKCRTAMKTIYKFCTFFFF